MAQKKRERSDAAGRSTSQVWLVEVILGHGPDGQPELQAAMSLERPVMGETVGRTDNALILLGHGFHAGSDEPCEIWVRTHAVIAARLRSVDVSKAKLEALKKATG